MRQNYKIYLNDSEILVLEEGEAQVMSEGYSLITYESELSNISSYLDKLPPKSKNIIWVENKEAFFKQLMQQLPLIHAAGGIIHQPESNALLCIFRKGKWDLPKGKIDEGEASDKAAWREVQEECGISTHEIHSFFQSSFHFYTMKKQWVLKQTDWYLMTAQRESLIPQTEEDISEAAWIPFAEMKKVYANTYPLIYDLIQAYHETIA